MDVRIDETQPFPRYAVLYGALLLIFIAAAPEPRLRFVIVRTKSGQPAGTRTKRIAGLGGQIASIKDADLTSTNDFISAYAQIEPLEKNYEVKLQEFRGLYQLARERNSHRGWLELERWRERHHPETWERMSEIIGLVRGINEIT